MGRMAAFSAGSLLAGLACVAAVKAHHSGSMYVTTPVWVSGTVVGFDNVNPHTITSLEERSTEGEVRLWALEGPGRTQLGRLGVEVYVPTVGDTIEFCAFTYKTPEELSRMFPGVDFSARHAAAGANGESPRFAAGHVMVMPDGQMQLWEPHGLISECIRISDERKSWASFLNSDPRGRDAWCQQKRYTPVQSSAHLEEVVEEIDRMVDNPC